MAKGKFSQPRNPHRREITMRDVDFSAVTKASDAEVPAEPVPAPAPESPAAVPESSPRKVRRDPDETMPLPTAGIPLVPPQAEEPLPSEPADETEEPEEDYEYETMDPAAKRRKITFICLCATAAVLLVAVIIGGVLLLKRDADDGLILNNVTVAGVNLGGMTQEMAASVLHQATDQTYTTRDMVIKLPDTTITLSPADTRARLDVDAAVKAAFDYGRSGSRSENAQLRQDSLTNVHHIALLPYLNLNTEKIRSVLNEYAESFNSSFSESSARITGTVPQLNAAEPDFDLNAPCQVLTLTLGTPGRHIDVEKLYNQVLDAYSFNRFEVVFTDVETQKEPEAFDLEELYSLYAKESKDATMDMETFEVIPGVYGYDFDLEKAQQALDKAEYGDVIEIPLRLVPPEHNTEDLQGTLFRDVLGSYSTPHTADQNRNTNLTLACKAINGTVLYPGDTFDYNKVVGERTAAAGYKAAAAYSNGETVQALGGGVCQVSSTIYYCVLLADLEVVTRYPHSYVSSYMPMGMDATVSWGGPEFRFKNNTNYPIRIEANVADGNVNVKLLGTDEKKYYIKMEYQVLGQTNFTTIYEAMPSDNEKGYKDGEVIQTPYTGYTVQTYKCKYDKETDALISRDKEALSAYKVRDRIIVKIEDPTEPSTEATQPTTEATSPTTEATQPTTEATQPTTEPPATESTPTESSEGGSE